MMQSSKNTFVKFGRKRAPGSWTTFRLRFKPHQGSIVFPAIMSHRRFRDLCTSALALFVALWLSGGQSMVLQVTAWSGMLVTRTLESGVGMALASTFDGEHPCPLCTAIKSAEGDKSSPESPAPLKTPGKLKIDANIALHKDLAVPVTEIMEVTWQEKTPSWPTCDLDPPVPPPRLAA